MRWRFSCLMILCLLATQGQAEIYRWVDAEGKTHFSDKPPRQAPYEDIEGRLHINTVSGNLFFRSLDPQDLRERVKVSVKLVDFKMTQEQLAEAEDRIRLVYGMYERFFEWPGGRAFPINVTLVGNEAEFRKVANHFGFLSQFYDGVFDNTTNEAYVLANGSWEQTLRTILHETSHAIIHMQVRHAPIWINEGMAVNMEGLVLQDGDLYLQFSSARAARLAGRYQDGQVPMLRHFLAMPASAWRNRDTADDVEDMYAMAWSVVHFFLTDESRRKVLRDMLQTAGRQPDAFDARYLINLKYPGGVERFSREWNAWLDGQLVGQRS